jgi:DNA-binding MarR family transcriptional regulator
MPPYPGLLIAAARRRIKRAVLDRVTEWRLTPQQFWMLIAIQEHPGISQVEIAGRTRAEAPDVSRALSALAERGLVRTEVDPDDRRRTRVWLTRSGARTTKELAPIARSLREAIVAGMRREEIVSLCTALERVVENLDALDARTSRERERA